MLQKNENRLNVSDGMCRSWKMLTSLVQEKSEKWTLTFSVAMNQDESSHLSRMSSESLYPLKTTPTKRDTDYESSRLSLSCDLLVDYNDVVYYEVTSHMNNRKGGMFAEKSLLYKNMHGEEILPTKTGLTIHKHRHQKNGTVRKRRVVL